MGIHYTIISRPHHIRFECPHCGGEVEIPFRDVDYNTDYWGDDAFCTCPACDRDVELDEFEYD